MEGKYTIDTSGYQTPDEDYHLEICISYEDGVKKVIEGPIIHSPNDVGGTGYWVSDGNYIFVVFNKNDQLESTFDITQRCKLKDEEQANSLWLEYLDKLSKDTKPVDKSPYVLNHLPRFKQNNSEDK